MGDLSDGLPADPLVRGLAEGREGAFAELYDRFGNRLFRAAFAMLGSREDAEDMVQEVFTSMYHARRSLATVRNLTGYVFAALRHAAGRRANRLRAWRRGRIAAVETARGRTHNSASMQKSSELERALRSLPPEQRQVIALKIDAGLTFVEIGAALDISPNTAASRYRYALEKLRVVLREEP